MPDSVLILAAIPRAAAEACGVRQYEIACAKFWAVRDLCGMGFGPAPATATMLPQNCWLDEKVSGGLATIYTSGRGLLSEEGNDCCRYSIK